MNETCNSHAASNVLFGLPPSAGQVQLWPKSGCATQGRGGRPAKHVFYHLLQGMLSVVLASPRFGFSADAHVGPLCTLVSNFQNRLDGDVLSLTAGPSVLL